MDEKVKENFESEYSLNEKVFIHNGFYKNRYGTIKEYDTKIKKYMIETKQGMATKYIYCTIEDIRHMKKMLWIEY